jgi:O-antigen/teichoic acid export membrane protein
MGNAQVLIYFKKTKYLLLITIIQTILIFFLSYKFIPIYGAKGALFALWVGTFIYMLLYYKLKRILFKQPFIETTFFPYVFIYHFAVLLILQNNKFLGNIFIYLLSLFITAHLIYLYRNSIHIFLSKIKRWTF